MAGKNSKNQKNNKVMEEKVAKRQKTAQIMFAAFAILLIISMVLSAVAKY
ncbi:MAG TPA: hypothetical protein PKE23_01455 [Anaerolineales bacterium]|nr:hypothetical protein [Anaerolineales bacterium]HND48629.1 hypothetical protein [Anaerolineales bacterium]HNE04360.1 hypothetical protein [Anaerolineales bacterium]HNF93636.1 hypothetical protein [Anaerolineales bacterium]HNM36614.1 hypothetical protein [Anaerolineales bacterium]